MSYQSPIELIQPQIQNLIEGEIYKAVIRVGVNVDKEELLKALHYDREQYEKGYKDRDDQIVRCQDCKNWFGNGTDPSELPYWLPCKGLMREPDYFCADGKRRDDDD